MLGSQMVKVFLNENFEVFTTSRSILTTKNHFNVDLTNSEEVVSMLNNCNPSLIIHCAANTNLKNCELNVEQCESLHQSATKLLVEYKSVKKIVYISTDSVFDGIRGDFKETDETNPLNKYASTKLKGEQIVLESDKVGYVIRTNILGFNNPIKSSLFEWAYSELKHLRGINGFKDVVFNPLYTLDLAKLCKQFIDLDLEKGIYHIASKSSISKYELLLKIQTEFTNETKLVKPISIDEITSTQSRPKNTILNTSKIELLGLNIPSIDETLRHLFLDFKNSDII